jgi:electron transfer flavoprotein beta subunit
MKIAVLIKQVPDTESRIVINPDKNGIETTNIKFIVSPYDEIAIEQAVQMGGETFAICVGDARSTEALRTALSMGIQSAVHIDTESTQLDSFQTATVIAEFLKQKKVDLILCGKQGIDHDNSLVPGMVAEMMGVAHVLAADRLELNGDTLRIARRETRGTRGVFDCPLPALISCDRGLNTPRYPSLPNIMKAKSKPIEKILAAQLLNDERPLTRFGNYTLAPERGAGKVLEGNVETQVEELVRLLREEAKVL